MAKALSAEVMWQARQLYEEKDEDGRRRFSMLEVAARLGISEGSVYRAVKNQGRFANLKNRPLPEVKSEELLNEEAAASLVKLQRMLAEEKVKEKRGDELVKELMEKKGVSETVAKQVAFYTGKDEEK